MVSTTENNNVPTVKSELTGLPEGRYRLVGWDIDTTGRRITDEICQIGAYTSSDKYDQYIMPYADLNIYAQRRHNIRVVTVTYYRMLKDLKTNKFLKTKSEISALTDFLTWLESIRGDATDGVILVFHEVRKVAPGMLLEALRRYNLLERFSAVVKAFANSYVLAETQCAKTMKSFSLKVLARVLLDKEEDLDNAANRARLCYLVVQHLGQGERQDLDAEGSGDEGALERHAAELIRQYAQTVATEEKELVDLKMLLERQNTFRPIFKSVATDYVNHQYVTRLQRHLAENNLDCEQLKNAWEHGGRKGIENLLRNMSDVNEKEHNELLEIFDCYFDPEKKPFQLQSRPRRTSSRSQKSTNGEKSKATSSGGGNSSDTSTNANSALSSPNNSATPRDEAVAVESVTVEPVAVEPVAVKPAAVEPAAS